MDAFLGMIMPFAGNFAPQGWALCNGQLLSINQYTALYSLLGTVYGGNGTTTFGVPNLSGRAIVGAGQLPNGGSYVPGQTGGAENVTLTQNQLPAHTHTLQGTSVVASVGAPAGNLLSRTGQNQIYAPPGGAVVSMDNSAISSTGGGQPVPTTTPYQCVNYIICTQGIYPPRP